jgi:hypothetical protein
MKVGLNWGHMVEVPLLDDLDALASKLEATWKELAHA